MQIKHTFILNSSETLNSLLQLFADNKFEGRMLLSGFGAIAQFESLTDEEQTLIGMFCVPSKAWSPIEDILNTFGGYPEMYLGETTKVVSSHSEKLFISYIDGPLIQNKDRILVKQWDL